MKLSEMVSRFLVVIGLLILTGIPFIAKIRGTQNIIEIHGRMAEKGGWTPGTLQTRVGVPLHLRLTSDDVMHGFAIGQNDMPAVDVTPGKMTDVTLNFDRPGTYTYYCTRWCGPNHWRMRGTIEVSGGEQPAQQTVPQPQYMALNLDIDAAHPSGVTAGGMPDALRGVAIYTKLPEKYLSQGYYYSHSPSQVFLDLRDDPALASLNDINLWDLVAYIWQSNATPAGLVEGQKLFAQNCAACHGEAGGGDGVFSGDILALAGKSPAKFVDPTSMLGAAPALLQGKILRGGMGTGMPSWGPILTNQQTWDLISYLYSFTIKIY